MKIQFIGATHEVTGSCTLLEVGGRYYLVDCGMEQGTDVFQNIPLPVPANAIEAVFLTHAHIDHSGMLPKLCKDGFSGAIYATEATCNLCNIMLRDSAHIQESEAQWRSRKAERAGLPPVEPTYTTNDALAAIKQLRPCKYMEPLQVAEGIILRMTDIGHLLGSAAIELWLTEDRFQRRRGQHQSASAERSEICGRNGLSGHRIHLRRPVSRKSPGRCCGRTGHVYPADL